VWQYGVSRRHGDGWPRICLPPSTDPILVEWDVPMDCKNFESRDSPRASISHAAAGAILTLGNDGLATVGGMSDRLVLRGAGVAPRDGIFVVRWVP
jgi:hypothetical protein